MKTATSKPGPERSANTPLGRGVEEGLRELTLSGELQSGARVRGRELVDIFRVSRTSLREALRR